MTVPKEATEGREFRREFNLPAEDLEFLECRGHPWEAIVEGGTQWVLLHGFEVPHGYNVAHAVAAIRIVGGYPEVALDMVYFEPHLARTDGKAINALSALSIDGRNFQQWSRHRPPSNPWQVGDDGLASRLQDRPLKHLLRSRESNLWKATTNLRSNRRIVFHCRGQMACEDRPHVV